jgi:hypothetical protein
MLHFGQIGGGEFFGIGFPLSATRESTLAVIVNS